MFDHEKIAYGQLIYIAHAFAKPDEGDNLIFEEGDIYSELVQAAHNHKFQKGRCYGYRQVMSFLHSRWEYIWDDCAKVSYQQDPEKKQIICYDDERSISLKCRLSMKMKLRVLSYGN